jgi:N-acetylneuraminic acid mutarotase
MLIPESWQVGRFLFTQVPQRLKFNRRIAGYTPGKEKWSSIQAKFNPSTPPFSTRLETQLPVILL